MCNTQLKINEICMNALIHMVGVNLGKHPRVISKVRIAQLQEFCQSLAKQ